MSDLTKPSSSPPPVLSGGKLRSNATSPFQQRIAQAKAVDSNDNAEKMPNRIVLMLDCSGSMYGESIENLKEAVQNFAQRCNFADTSVAIETFPRHKHSLELTCNRSLIMNFVHMIDAGGDTPMRKCVEWCIEGISMTRGVIVSDGSPTDWHGNFEYEMSNDSQNEDSVLKRYIEQKIPLDCVHIGDATSGEAFLKKIAEATGGIFLKFTDTSAFSTAFGYLTPAFRAMLTSGEVNAKGLGAKEIQK